jgi:hypothetical protein
LEVLALLLLALALAGLVRTLLRADEEPEDADFDPRSPAVARRVVDLASALTGRPEIDRAIQNRMLALGPPAIPALLRSLMERQKHPDELPSAVLARLEETLADYGLACVPVVLAQLSRIQPATSAAASMLRVLDRLGPGGARQILSVGLAQPGLAMYLPRTRLDSPAREARTLLKATLRDVPAHRRRETLEALAGLLAAHRPLVVVLWQTWDDTGRAVLLRWMADWLPLAEPSLIVEGLRSADPEVALEAGRLARLVPDAAVRIAVLERLNAAAEDRSTPTVAVRSALVAAVAAHPDADGAQRLWALVADAEPAVAVEAAASVLGYPALFALARLETTSTLDDVADETRADPRWPLVEAAQRDEIGPLLEALESPDDARRFTACTLLGRFVGGDPRAKERLVRAVEARDAELAAVAVLTLARCGDPSVAELVPKPPRTGASVPCMRTLQEAAQVVGEPAAVPLARRLRGESGGRCEALLAVLRAVPMGTAVPPLLRALESVQGGEAEGLVAATLAVGGPEVHAALVQALDQPGRGLLAPMLHYLGAYGAPADLPQLLDLYDRHPSLRSVLLALIELQGAPARDALRVRIARGGDDALLLPLEQRLRVLEACHGTH